MRRMFEINKLINDVSEQCDVAKETTVNDPPLSPAEYLKKFTLIGVYRVLMLLVTLRTSFVSDRG